MSKAAKKSFKRTMAEHLRNFGNELYSSGYILDKKPFEDAANQCQNGLIPTVAGNDEVDYANSWGYTLNNVLFKVTTFDSTTIKPHESKIDRISLDVTVIGKFTRDDIVCDPLSHLEFNLLIKGFNKNKKPIISSWHLDRNLEGESDPNDAHPVYHFQYGGKNLKFDGEEFIHGSNMILDSPRIAHLPLDGILGADFILSNFFGKEWKEGCKRSSSYVKYVNDAITRLWRPYAYTCFNHWKTYQPTSCEWTTDKIWPQLKN